MQVELSQKHAPGSFKATDNLRILCGNAILE
jgi:hypothetical protein